MADEHDEAGGKESTVDSVAGAQDEQDRVRPDETAESPSDSPDNSQEPTPPESTPKEPESYKSPDDSVYDSENQPQYLDPPDKSDNDNDDEWIEDIRLPKAKLIERYFAKAIDFLIAGALFESFPYTGPAAAIVYLLIADAIGGGGKSAGRSVGKRIVGLKTVSPVRSGACDFMDSAVRNATFAAVVFAYVVVGAIPYVGKFVVFIAALSVVFLEAVVVYYDEKGIRFGDRLAKTMVVKA